MSDSTLRTLERRAAADPVDERAAAALLAQRLRSGEVARPRLELLAALGEPAAAEVLGRPLPRPPRADELPRFAAGLARFEREAALRAASALLARLFAEDVVRDEVWDDERAPLLGVLEAALTCPCPRRQGALAGPAQQLAEWLEEGLDVGAFEPGDYAPLAAEALLAACEAAQARDEAALARAVARSVERAARALAALGRFWRESTRYGGNAADAAHGAALASRELPLRTVLDALRAWARAGLLDVGPGAVATAGGAGAGAGPWA